MAEELTLFGKKASNLIGALGEIIAWDTLRKMGIWAYKIGTWDFFPKDYPHFRDKELTFLTRKQAEFIERKGEYQYQSDSFDFVGVKWKRTPTYGLVEINGRLVVDTTTLRDVGVAEDVYLIEVKTGRGANIRYYAKNPMRAFSPENLEKAKAIGFKVGLVVVELLEKWKCRISYREV